MTPRPPTGPWIVPANEARGAYVTTIMGPMPIMDHVPNRLLRQDQILTIKKKEPLRWGT